MRVLARARRRFRALGETKRRGEYTFTTEGFAWTLGPAPGRAPWAGVTRVQETSAHWFFMTKSFRTHVVPKEGIDEEKLQRLRELAGLRNSS